MSLIATFWTIDAAKLDELIEAFKPRQTKTSKKVWFWFRRTRTNTIYPWFKYLKVNATNEGSFAYGGGAIVELELIIPENASLFNMSIPEVGSLNEYFSGSAALVDQVAARTVHDTMAAFPIDRASVIQFFESDGRPLDAASEAEPVLAAYHQVQQWCTRVGPGRLGLLIIG